MIRALYRPLTRSRLSSSFATHTLNLAPAPDHANDRTGAAPEEPRDIFEDAPAEYSAIPKQPTSSYILSLVREQKFSSAETLRQHLQDRGLSIPPNNGVYAAARSIVEERGDVDAFAECISLLPELNTQAHSNTEDLNTTIDYLLSSPSDNLDYIRAFALILAYKGYISTVRQRLLPHVSRHSTYEEFTEIFHAVEASSADYLRAHSSSPPVTKTSEQETASIFDTEQDDYGAFADTAADLTPAPTLAEHLETLVAQGQYALAKELRKEIVSIGVHIPPSPIYSLVANNLLRSYTARNQVEAFDAWLAQIPDASLNQQPQHIERFTAYLCSMYRPNIVVIDHCAVLFARKGYVDLVARLLPVLIRFTPGNNGLFLLSQLEKMLSKYFRRKGVSREETSRTIVSLRTLTTKTQAVTGWYKELTKLLDRCDADGNHLPLGTLRSITQRYLLDGVDSTSSDFQQVNKMIQKWYPSPAPASPSLTTVSGEGSEPQELALVVQRGLFSKAEDLRLYMEKSGFSIRPHPAYAEAAAHVIRRASSPRVRAEELAHLHQELHAWLKLLPAASLAPSEAMLEPLKRTASWPTIRPSLNILLALHCAEQGHHIFLKRLVNQIVRRSSISPEVLLRFMSCICHKVQHYNATNPDLTSNRLFLRRLVRNAISACTRENQLAGALALARWADKHFSHDEVSDIPFLGEGEDVSVQEYIPFVQSLDVSLANPESNSHTTPSLLTTTRYLQRAFTPTQNQTSFLSPPTSSALATFIGKCARLGRPNLIALLERRALRCSRSAATEWSSGLMLNAYRRNNYDQALHIFSDFYFLVGVFRHELIQNLLATKSTRTFPSPTLYKGRLAPGPAQVALVWHCLVAKARALPSGNYSAIKLLHLHFMGAVRVSKAHSDQSTTSANGAKILQLRPPPNQFNASCFTPILSAVSQMLTPRDGSQILKCMMEVGIPPTVRELGIVAEAYAKEGLVEDAMKILSAMEAGDGKPPSLPRPNVAVYAAVLQGFIASEQYEAAKVIEKRIVGMGYTWGSNPAVDAPLRFMRMSRKWMKPRTE